jgi:hypothetical protein
MEEGCRGKIAYVEGRQQKNTRPWKMARESMLLLSRHVLFQSAHVRPSNDPDLRWITLCHGYAISSVIVRCKCQILRLVLKVASVRAGCWQVIDVLAIVIENAFRPDNGRSAILFSVTDE